MKPTVTIFADASVDPATMVAGWACWIKADGETSIIRGAALKDPVRGTGQAELMALANALSVAKAAGLLRGHVMLQSDSIDSLAAIRKRIQSAVDNPATGGLSVGRRKSKVPPAYRSALREIEAVVKETGITLAVRHVKGHRQGGGRNWVNRQCDKVAKRHMRELRDGARVQGEQA